MGRDWRRQPARQEGVEGAALIGDRRPELAGGGFGLDTFGIRAVFAPYRQFGRTPRVPQRFGLSCERSHNSPLWLVGYSTSRIGSSGLFLSTVTFCLSLFSFLFDHFIFFGSVLLFFPSAKTPLC